MAKRQPSKLVTFGLGGFAAAVCLFLVGHSIVSSSNLRLADIVNWFRAPFLTSEERGQQGDEVRSYVLFTKVGYGNWTVTTGTHFRSSSNRQIESEWCYLRKAEIDGEASEILNLARIDGSGKETFPRIIDESLSSFNLTAARARSLAETHCRFQSERKP